MTVSTIGSKNVYNGNGVTTLWAYTFPIIDSTDIQVYITDNASVNTLLVTGYTVDTINSRVVYPVGSGLAVLPTGWKITILRAAPLTQGVDLKNQGPFNAEVIEQSLDKLTMIVQQHEETLARAVKYPVDETPTADDTDTFLLNIQASETAAAGSASAASTSQTAAASSATAAATSATNSATSATAASASQSAAATSATNAASSATAASGSASAASTSATAAAGSATAASGSASAASTSQTAASTSATNASNSASAASTSATNAATSATAAANSATAAATSETNAAASAATVSNATDLNTAGAIVKRDSSGNFSAGTMTGNVTGNVTGNLTGNASGSAASITGVNPVAKGGTGVATLPSKNVLIGNGTSAVTGVAPSTTGNILTSNGTDWVSSAPSSSPTPAGAMAMYGGFTAPSGWLFTDGSVVSRATYAALFAALSISTTGNTTSGSAIITAIPSTTGWSVGMPVSGAGIPAAATILSVDSASQIHISANATATATAAAIVVAPYGIGDGSTTFNLPDSRGIFFRGIGTHGSLKYAKTAQGNVVGPVLGAYQNDSVQGHIHTLNTGMSPNNNTAAATGASPLGQFTTPTVSTPSDDGTHGTPRTGYETAPFSVGVNYIIKT